MIVRTWNGTTTATISSPKVETDRPMKSDRNSPEIRKGVRSIRCPRARCNKPFGSGGSGRGATGRCSTGGDARPRDGHLDRCDHARDGEHDPVRPKVEDEVLVRHQQARGEPNTADATAAEMGLR